MIYTFCPRCKARLEFFSRIPHNECRNCLKPLSFDSGMAKDQQKRVEYHVCSETDINTRQPDVNFMFVR